MDPFWILGAFVFGVAASRVSLPPLVGYLLAGFVLNGLNIEGGEILNNIADAGVTLLLFTIGLKLKLKTLIKPEVWAGATIHMGVTMVFFSVFLWTLGISGIGIYFLADLNWPVAALIAFALSFSSTVFAIKVIEGKRETASRHAVTAIGILIMQDIIAVIFLAASKGAIPSIWSLPLIAGMLTIRPVLAKFMARCGHGELLMLFGIVMTVTGYSSFELVGLKGDLGALVFGMLLAPHAKASELSDMLLGFKDLFLIGFFLNIGISGSLTPEIAVTAFFLSLAVPFKTGLFFFILTRFRLRARTSLLASFNLSNYSEFGLIVCSLGVSKGWVGNEWLVVIAISLSLTFIMAAPVNYAAHNIYAFLSGRIKRFETRDRLPDDKPIETGDARIAVIGMGGVGKSAYDEMKRRHGDIVIGIDFNIEKVSANCRLGRTVLYGDAGDSDFWERIEPTTSRIELVMLAVPDPKTSIFAIQQMKKKGYNGQITASVRYMDEIPLLEKEGINAVYSLYEEAGVGFADHVCDHMDYCEIKEKDA
ncbi:MAG: potassium transporter Kef [Desulfobacteraceae bacterium]|nr:MAG: potassium transporter Kef [Desulfobacteraceae bacterium]